MATLAEQVQGERMARVALSMIAEPSDAASGLSSPTCLVTPDGAEDRLRVGGNLGLEGELLAVDLDRR